MNKIFLNSSLNSEKIEQYIDKKRRTKIRLISLGFSALICVSPIFLLANLVIFIDYIFLITAAIAAIVLAFLELNDLFAYIMYKNDCEELKGLKIQYNILNNLFINLILVLVMYVVAAIVLGVIFVW